MSYRNALNIEDLRRMAEKRLPRVAYDFLAGGVEDDVSLANNRAAFEPLEKVASDVAGGTPWFQLYMSKDREAARTLLDSGVPRFQNLGTSVGGRIIAKPMDEFRARREALDRDDFRWLRELWPRKLFLKGVLALLGCPSIRELDADYLWLADREIKT